MHSNYTIKPFDGSPREPIIRHYEENDEPLYLKVCCPYGCSVHLPGHDTCPKCGNPIIPMTMKDAHLREEARARAEGVHLPEEFYLSDTYE